MEALTFSSSSSTFTGRKYPNELLSSRRRRIFSICARREGKGRDFDGKIVDENMIVLRMRIKDMETRETQTVAPSDWMEWEKRYYGDDYKEDVCEAVGLLQMFLMNTRPCLALGLVLLVALSLPVSGFVIIFNVIMGIFN